MKKKISFLLVIAMLLCSSSAFQVNAAELYQENAKMPGWHVKDNGERYFIRKNGKKATGWMEIEGTLYYFEKNGILSKKKGWATLNGKRYYVCADRSRCKDGIFRLGDNKLYYFNPNGVLITNRKAVNVDDKYYDIDSNGVATEISSAEVKSRELAKTYVKRHTKENQTREKKLKAVYDSLLLDMRYRAGSTKRSQFYETDWPYKKAVDVFTTMTGNCYSFACCFSACAKELGYKPIVIVTSSHGFVRIGDLYYDNLSFDLFAVKEPSLPESRAYMKVEF